MKTSKKEINRLGDRIRANPKQINSENLLQLEDFRISHKDSLSEIFNILCQESQKVYRSPIVTYRIKRFESIIKKLDRFPKMQFARMGDIGGCRVILNSETAIYKLYEKLDKLLIINKVKDYIKQPAKDGYRSLHIYATLPNDNITIEIQLRNPDHQNWATMVEISDFLFDSKLKEYGEDKLLVKFHKYLSQDMAELTLTQKKYIVDILIKYKYLEELQRVFSRNYINTRLRWVEIEKRQSNQNYFLIQSDKYQTPIIDSFPNFQEAEKEYLRRYKLNSGANMVLTHTTNSKYKTISIAYSNYILSYHSYINKFYEILEDLIKESIEKNYKLRFWNYFKFHREMTAIRAITLVTEISTANTLLKFTFKNDKLDITKKEKSSRRLDWLVDIKVEIEKQSEINHSIIEAIKIYKKHNYINREIYWNLVKYIMWNNNRKIRKVIKNK